MEWVNSIATKGAVGAKMREERGKREEEMHKGMMEGWIKGYIIVIVIVIVIVIENL